MICPNCGDEGDDVVAVAESVRGEYERMCYIGSGADSDYAGLTVVHL